MPYLQPTRKGNAVVVWGVRVLPDLRHGEAVFELQRVDLNCGVGVLVEKGEQGDGGEEGGREDDEAEARAVLLLGVDGEGERHD